MKEQIKTIVITLSVLILGLVVGGEFLHLREQAFAQTGGLRREPGVVFTKGCFVELSSGAAVAAGDALYLDSAGKVQKLTAAQDANVVGVADNTVASADETVRVQFCGKATLTGDGAVTIGDKVGGTGVTTAGRVATLASTLSVDAGGTTVTSTAANGAIISGDSPANRVLRRALTAAAGAGNTFTLLITLN